MTGLNTLRVLKGRREAKCRKKFRTDYRKEEILKSKSNQKRLPYESEGYSNGQSHPWFRSLTLLAQFMSLCYLFLIKEAECFTPAAATSKDKDGASAFDVCGDTKNISPKQSTICNDG